MSRWRIGVDHSAGFWFREPVREMTIFAERYDLAVSLLLLEDRPPFYQLEAEQEIDAFDQLSPQADRREWWVLNPSILSRLCWSHPGP